jgi:hypothetical protein
VFLSHAKEDKLLVRELFHLLELDGFFPWLDEMMLLAGQDWRLEIQTALQQSHIVVVFVSSSGVDRAGYLHKEISLAIEAAQLQPEGSLYLIPILLGKCDAPRGLDHLHWLKLPDHPNGLARGRLERASSAVSLYLTLRPSLLRRVEQLRLITDGEIDEVEYRLRGMKGVYISLLVEPGTYLVRGQNSDGSCYYGKAKLTVPDGGQCMIAYDIGGQETVYGGSIRGRNHYYTLEYLSERDTERGVRLTKSHSRIRLKTHIDRYGVTWTGEGFEELIPASSLERIKSLNPYKVSARGLSR